MHLLIRTGLTPLEWYLRRTSGGRHSVEEKRGRVEVERRTGRGRKWAESEERARAMEDEIVQLRRVSSWSCRFCSRAELMLAAL